MDITYLKRVDITNLAYHPLFVDYNFKESRPRGGSACFDFFACGKLCSLMDNVSDSGLVYIKKDNILPLDGFFLVDFARVKENPQSFLDSVRKLNLSHMYIENSPHFPLDEIVKEIAEVQVSLVSFTV